MPNFPTLNSPPLAEGDVQGFANALWNEWLGDYFDGNQHQIGVSLSGVTFPAAVISFEQSVAPQPLFNPTVNPPNPPPSAAPAQCEIRVVQAPKQAIRDDLPPSSFTGGVQGWTMRQPTVVNFWIRAKAQGVGEAELLARNVSNLLFSLLNNPCNAEALAQKGIKHVKPVSPRTIPSGDWKMAVVACPCDYEWTASFNPTSSQ